MSPNNAPRGRKGNTLIELIIYIGLTIVITVGLANVIARIRTAQYTTDVRTEVQQTVRASLQQLTALGSGYESVTCLPDITCLVAPTEIRLWNQEDNEGFDPLNPEATLETYLKIWIDPETAILYVQNVQESVPTTASIQLTPSSVRVSEFRVNTAQLTESKTPSLGINIRIADRTSTSSTARDSFTVTTAIPLRAEGVPVSDVCCPLYLTGFCALSVPICKDGCFVNGQAGTVAISQSLERPTVLAIDTIKKRLFVGSESPSKKIVLVYQLDANNKPIPNVPPVTLGDQPSNASQRFSSISGLAYDVVSQRLFVADSTKNRVLVYDVNHIEPNENAQWVLGQPSFTTNSSLAGAKGMSGPRGLAFDSAERKLYVADSGNHRIMVFDVSSLQDGQDAIGVFGKPLLTSPPVTNPPTNASSLKNPYAIAIDGARNRLFVSDTGNNRVVMYDSEEFGSAAVGLLGHDTFIANGAPGAVNATSFSPQGISYDSQNDRLFVTDPGRNRILIFSTKDVAAPVAGSPLAATHVLGQPSFTDGTGGSGLSDLNQVSDVLIDRTQQRVFAADFVTGLPRVMAYQGGLDPTCGGINLSSRGLDPFSSSAQSSSSSEAALACNPPSAGALAGRINENITNDPNTAPTSPTNTSDFIEICGASDSVFFDLTDVPGNFAAAESVTYKVVYRVNPGISGQFGSFNVSVMQGDKQNLLASGASYALYGEGPNEWLEEDRFVGANGIVGDNSKNGWNNAKLRVTSTHASSLIQISAIEVHVDDGSGSPVILRVSGDAGGLDGATAWKGVGQVDPSLMSYWPMERNSDIPERINDTAGEHHGVFTRRTLGAGSSFSDTEVSAIWSSAHAAEQFPLISTTESLSLQNENANQYYLVSAPDNADFQQLNTNNTFSVSFYESRRFGPLSEKATLVQRLQKKTNTAVPPVTEWKGWNIGVTPEGKYRVSLYTGGQNPYLGLQTIDAYPPGNAFRHVVVTYDGSDSNILNRLRVYVNGVMQGLQIINECGSAVPPTGPCQLFDLSYTMTAPFPAIEIGPVKGLVDEVKIFDRVIDPLDAQ